MQKGVEEKVRIEFDLHEDEERQEEDEFSFTSSFGELSLVSADEAFVDGEIKPVFPLFNQELLFDGGNLPRKPAVKKIFVETKEEDRRRGKNREDDSADVISGPYCDLSSRRVVEVTSSSDACKKSNSTGFSKIWRFKDLVSRTNSDGRDAYVFLNEHHAPPSKTPEKMKSGVAVRPTDKRQGGGNRRASAPPYSAHEVYLRRKGKEDKKRTPTYLPYRPELMGLFTTVNGGFSRNVHPY